MNARFQLSFCLRLVGWFFWGAWGASAQLEIVRRSEIQCRFGGGPGTIQVVMSNRADNPLRVQARTRLVQTSSSTAILLGEAFWKKLELLPRQSVVEAVTVFFPAVRAETRFLVQWLDGTHTMLGQTEVRVFPTNLLARLRPLVGDLPLGVFDPANQLKPLLQTLDGSFQDLIEDGTDKFHGKLAIFGPFASLEQTRESLAHDIRALAKRGVAVVWLQPPPAPRAPLKPSFYTVHVGNGAVVVAQGEMVSRLAESPEAQLNLIWLAEAALHPEPFDLPEPRNSN